MGGKSVSLDSNNVARITQNRCNFSHSLKKFRSINQWFRTTFIHEACTNSKAQDVYKNTQHRNSILLVS